MGKNKTIILGAGVTGLSVGISTGYRIFEAAANAGGVCASYYINHDYKKAFSFAHEEAYRFEAGGGHWIFGADNHILKFINELSPIKSYTRKSAVYFPEWNLYVPYPLQNHLSYLPKDIAQKALSEIHRSPDNNTVTTLADWLQQHFGRTLCEYFFFPFHELYTAGLYTEIIPQDKYKTPVNKELIVRGFHGETPPVGYNSVFVYPSKGLDDFVHKMVEKCMVTFNAEVISIDTKKREVFFKDGTSIQYDFIFSTLPLNKTQQLAHLDIDEPSDPYTSVLVMNIGAQKGKKCPDQHWLYLPTSKTGFHRVGFYSKVDKSFLPLMSRNTDSAVSIYVEKAYPTGTVLSKEEVKKNCDNTIKELQNWGFIEEVDVIDPTWIEVAYTWESVKSTWREKTLSCLAQNNIYQIGRYGKWKFQGIAESIKDGLEARNILNG